MSDLRRDHASLQGAVRTVAQLLVTQGRVEEVLEQAATLALGAVPPTSAAAIVVFDDRGRATTAVKADDSVLSAKLFAGNDGPAFVAHQERSVLVIDDIGHFQARWPEFWRAAAEQGISSVAAVPIVVGDRSLGALTLLSTAAGAYADLDPEEVAEFATQVGVAVTNSNAYWTTSDSGENLRDALQSRETIGLAKGLLMSASNCSSDEAFKILARASQRENVKLRDIAARIVASHDATSGA